MEKQLFARPPLILNNELQTSASMGFALQGRTKVNSRYFITIYLQLGWTRIPTLPAGYKKSTAGSIAFVFKIFVPLSGSVAGQTQQQLSQQRKALTRCTLPITSMLNPHLILSCPGFIPFLPAVRLLVQYHYIKLKS